MARCQDLFQRFPVGCHLKLPEARGGFLDGGRFEGYAASREDHEKVEEAAGKGANSSLVSHRVAYRAEMRKQLDSSTLIHHFEVKRRELKKVTLVTVCFSQIYTVHVIHKRFRSFSSVFVT